MSKKALFLAGILFSIFLISVVSACGWYDWCCSDDDCPDDFSEDYCFENDVYTEFHDFYCEGYECEEDIVFEFTEECGEDYCGDWDYYCKGDDVWRDRTCYGKGCDDDECYSNTNIQDVLYDSCSYMCVEGECIDEPIPEPECYIDSDCGTDQCAGGPNYCWLDDVYQDFITYTCNNPGQPDAYCSSEIVPLLLKECDCGCFAGECLDCPVEPICGNNIMEEGEQCDDGNTEDLDGCSSTCQLEQIIPEPICGNNIMEEGEQCDDGNTEDLDGCSSTCQLEQIPSECCDDSDCTTDYYSDKYCSGGDVYRDFHNFTCILGECVEEITNELFDECDSDEVCDNGECVDDDDDKKKGRCSEENDYCNIRYEVEDILIFEDFSEDSGSQEEIILSSKLEQESKSNFWLIFLLIGIVVLIILIFIIYRI